MTYTRTRAALRCAALRCAALRCAALMMVALGASEARATPDCNDGPPDIETPTCSCPCVVMADGPSGKKKISCNLDTNDESTSGVNDVPVQGVAVYDPDWDTDDALCDNEYCIWGYTTSGDHFVCDFDNQGGDLVGVELWGSALADQMWFYCDATNPFCDATLQAWDGYSHALKFFGRQYGLDGEDELQGSHESDDDHYIDMLEGGNDSDAICTLEGSDIVISGNGDDLVCLGEGDDSAFLGHGNDQCDAEEGNDHVRGENHLDDIRDTDGLLDIDGGDPSTTDADRCTDWTSLGTMPLG